MRENRQNSNQIGVNEEVTVVYKRNRSFPDILRNETPLLSAVGKKQLRSTKEIFARFAKHHLFLLLGKFNVKIWRYTNSNSIISYKVIYILCQIGAEDAEEASEILQGIKIENKEDMEKNIDICTNERLKRTITKFCNKCGRSIALNPLVCQQCFRALYCSRECKNDAWNSSHYVECQGQQNASGADTKYGIQDDTEMDFADYEDRLFDNNMLNYESKCMLTNCNDENYSLI
ncbi:MAG: Ankyrin repeat and MYND [Marteilia pararefringens]